MDWIDLLWWHTWWQFDPNGTTSDLILQHGFNLIEGASWLFFSMAVVRRYLRHRKSRNLELSYAFAFAMFGLSDFVQAYRLTSWLLAWKLVNLVSLLCLRHIIIRRYYPESRTY